MTVRDQIQTLRDEILEAAAANGARHVRLFGSAARGQETEGSDVDLLVTLKPGRTLLVLARLETRTSRRRAGSSGRVECGTRASTRIGIEPRGVSIRRSTRGRRRQVSSS